MIGSLFSGIGGLELGLERAGLGPTVWQVEGDSYCQRVLARHWPDARRYHDVRFVGGGRLWKSAALSTVDVICGGFPCQDVSAAGKGAGLAGSRSGLWREYARIVAELRPRWVVVENVASGARRWVDAVVRDLGQLRYACLPVPLSAADVGAPHLRRRIFIVARNTVADSDCESVRAQCWRSEARPQSTKSRLDGIAGAATHADSWGIIERPDGDGEAPHDTRALWREGPTVSPVCRVDDGVPRRVDRLRALGNAVVPQCAEVVGWMIRELEPEALLERLVAAYTDPGDAVLDPCCGSGTTVAVAHRMGRHGVGLDASPVACRFATARLEAMR